MEIQLITKQSCNALLDLRNDDLGFALYGTLDLHFDPLEFISASSGIDIPEDLILDPNAKSDGQNSIHLHKAMKGIRPSEAADKRLWVSLTHDRFREYTYTRWVEDRTITEGTIRNRFHFEGNGMETRMRNAISRLWWAAEMTHDSSNPDDPYHLTRVLWSNQDLFAGLTERSLGIYPAVMRSILEVVAQHPSMNEAARRRWLAAINAAGGVKSLPSLELDEAKQLVTSLAQAEGIM
jgi:hypothetical protein